MSDPTDGDAGDASGQPISEERIAELEERIEELRREVQPPRGPLGLPRPPTPGEVLRFADEHALPTAIAALEANVRALEALREAIGLLRRAEDRDLGERAGTLRDRTDGLAREAIEEFDRAVTDLAEAIEGGGLPDDEEARSVLQEARAVREEVVRALGNGTAEPGAENDDRATTGGDDSAEASDGSAAGGDGTTDDGGTEIDVEGELDSIREEVRGEGTGADGVADEGSDAGNANGTDGG